MHGLLAYMASNDSQMLSLCLQQLEMSAIAELLGILIAVPLGIVIARERKLVGVVLGVTNGFQTIPTLALLGFFLVLFGLGKVTAISVLFFYTLMPIVRGVYVGITSVDAGVVEAAKGMGMTTNQILWKVQLPLSLSALFVGIRLSAIVAVGTTTIMSLVGAGGIGVLIFTGLEEWNNQMILTGALLVAVVSVFVSWIVSFVARKITPVGMKIQPMNLR